MGAKRIAGSIRKVTLKGVTYAVAADANIKSTPSAFENTVVPCSGDNMRKMVKRAETREGIVLLVDGNEQEALKALAEGKENITMAYETAAGDTYRAQGWIEFESHETEENRASIQMHPAQGWSLFLGA